MLLGKRPPLAPGSSSTEASVGARNASASSSNASLSDFNIQQPTIEVEAGPIPPSSTSPTSPYAPRSSSGRFTLETHNGNPSLLHIIDPVPAAGGGAHNKSSSNSITDLLSFNTQRASPTHLAVPHGIRRGSPQLKSCSNEMRPSSRGGGTPITNFDAGPPENALTTIEEIAAEGLDERVSEDRMFNIFNRFDIEQCGALEVQLLKRACFAQKLTQEEKDVVLGRARYNHRIYVSDVVVALRRKALTDDTLVCIVLDKLEKVGDGIIQGGIPFGEYQEKRVAAMLSVKRRRWADNKPRRWWDMLQLFSIAFYCIGVLYWTNLKFTHDPLWLLLILVVIHVLWGLDLLLIFNVAVLHPNGKILSGWREVWNLKKTEIIIDAVAGCPIDLLFLALDGYQPQSLMGASVRSPTADEITQKSALFWCFYAVRTLKMLKLLSVQRLFQLVNEDFICPTFVSFQYGQKPIIIGIFTMAICAHAFAVIHNLLDTFFVSPRQFENYGDSLLAVCIMLSGSSATVRTHTLADSLFAIPIVMLCVMLQGALVGKLAAIVFSNSVSSQNKNHMIETLNVVRHFNVPHTVQREVLSFQQHVLNDDVARHLVNLATLPPKIQEELLVYMKVAAVGKIKIFGAASQLCKMKLASGLEQVISEPESEIISFGDEGSEMFLIAHGYADVVSKDGQIWTTFGRGDYFGEMALVTRNSKRTATIRALTYCDLWALAQEPFLEALGEFPEFYNIIKEVMAARKVNLEELEEAVVTANARRRGENLLERSKNGSFAQGISHTSVPSLDSVDEETPKTSLSQEIPGNSDSHGKKLGKKVSMENLMASSMSVRPGQLHLTRGARFKFAPSGTADHRGLMRVDDISATTQVDPLAATMRGVPPGRAAGGSGMFNVQSALHMTSISARPQQQPARFTSTPTQSESISSLTQESLTGQSSHGSVGRSALGKSSVKSNNLPPRRGRVPKMAPSHHTVTQRHAADVAYEGVQAKVSTLLTMLRHMRQTVDEGFGESKPVPILLETPSGQHAPEPKFIEEDNTSTARGTPASGLRKNSTHTVVVISESGKKIMSEAAAILNDNINTDDMSATGSDISMPSPQEEEAFNPMKKNRTGAAAMTDICLDPGMAETTAEFVEKPQTAEPETGVSPAEEKTKKPKKSSDLEGNNSNISHTSPSSSSQLVQAPHRPAKISPSEKKLKELKKPKTGIPTGKYPSRLHKCALKIQKWFRGCRGREIARDRLAELRALEVFSKQKTAKRKKKTKESAGDEGGPKPLATVDNSDGSSRVRSGERARKQKKELRRRKVGSTPCEESSVDNLLSSEHSFNSTSTTDKPRARGKKGRRGQSTSSPRGHGKKVVSASQSPHLLSPQEVLDHQFQELQGAVGGGEHEALQRVSIEAPNSQNSTRNPTPAELAGNSLASVRPHTLGQTTVPATNPDDNYSRTFSVSCLSSDALLTPLALAGQGRQGDRVVTATGSVITTPVGSIKSSGLVGNPLTLENLQLHSSQIHEKGAQASVSSTRGHNANAPPHPPVLLAVESQPMPEPFSPMIPETAPEGMEEENNKGNRRKSSSSGGAKAKTQVAPVVNPLTTDGIRDAFSEDESDRSEEAPKHPPRRSIPSTLTSRPSTLTTLSTAPTSGRDLLGVPDGPPEASTTQIIDAPRSSAHRAPPPHIPRRVSESSSTQETAVTTHNQSASLGGPSENPRSNIWAEMESGKDQLFSSPKSQAAPHFSAAPPPSTTELSARDQLLLMTSQFEEIEVAPVKNHDASDTSSDDSATIRVQVPKSTRQPQQQPPATSKSQQQPGPCSGQPLAAPRFSAVPLPSTTELSARDQLLLMTSQFEEIEVTPVKHHDASDSSDDSATIRVQVPKSTRQPQQQPPTTSPQQQHAPASHATRLSLVDGIVNFDWGNAGGVSEVVYSSSSEEEWYK